MSEGTEWDEEEDEEEKGLIKDEKKEDDDDNKDESQKWIEPFEQPMKRQVKRESVDRQVMGLESETSQKKIK
jgi:hypothetical protein